ncbi:hypothetical protein [Flavobacterium cupreum]|uniref:hypothetical protein n=1 Tax=Flavobacterium cupreum TaxID=2133766 RepID=UPI0013763815|nr:hypothetical protein [Flavobacterium cupreum]
MKTLTIKILSILFLILVTNINCSGYCDPDDLTRDQKDKTEAQLQPTHKDSVAVDID